MEEEIKQCPYCGENISLYAKKCKYCGEWLEHVEKDIDTEILCEKDESNIAKILKIKDGIVSVGNPDGSLTELRVEDCNFNPRVGDNVTIFSSNDKIICSKAKVKTTTEAEPKTKTKDKNDVLGNGSININVNNGSNNTGYVPSYPRYTYTVGRDKIIVNKVIYVVLAIVLGDFGIHKFYESKIGTGILYLLFCWTGIPAIIGFIEGILALFKQEDANGNIVLSR